MAHSPHRDTDRTATRTRLDLRERVQSRERHQFRPRLEILEDRTVPAMIFWDGGAGTLNWNDAANWSNDVLPTAADDVTVDVANEVVTLQIDTQDVDVHSLVSEENIVLSNVSLSLAANSQIKGSLSNNGEISLSSGELSLTGGGDHKGSFTVGDGATIQFSEDHTLQSSSSLTGAGLVRFLLSNTGSSGDSTTVAGTYDIGGSTEVEKMAVFFQGDNVISLGDSLIITGKQGYNTTPVIHTSTQRTYELSNLEITGNGTLNGGENDFNVGTLFADGSLNGSGLITVSGQATLEGGRLAQPLTTQGATTWQGSILFQDGGIFNNQGTLEVNGASASMVDQTTSAHTPAFNNSGSFTQNVDAVTVIDIPVLNTGTVNLQQGTLSLESSYVQQTGTLLLNGGSINAENVLDIQGGTLEGAGTVSGNVTMGGSTLPGLPEDVTETIAIDGAYIQNPSGNLTVDLGATDHDQLVVNGEVSLAGSLDVLLATDFTAFDTPLVLIQNDGSDPIARTLDLDGDGDLTEAIEEFVDLDRRLAFEFNYQGGDGNDLSVKINPTILIVSIDIKPGSDPNTINLGSNGNVPVAILSTPSFDATTVDPLSVTLADATIKVKGNGSAQISEEDVNNDGLLDLVVHVDTQGLVLTESDIEAVLVGSTIDGTAIRGVDTVRVIQGLHTAALGNEPNLAPLNTAQIEALLPRALAHWHAGESVGELTDIQLAVEDLPGTLLGTALGNSITLDHDAAGWGWFVDPTPWDDVEFTRVADRGQQNRMDLLTVLTHEVGHLLGFGHEDRGVMQETLSTGTRGLEPEHDHTGVLGDRDLLLPSIESAIEAVPVDSSIAGEAIRDDDTVGAIPGLRVVALGSESKVAETLPPRVLSPWIEVQRVDELADVPFAVVDLPGTLVGTVVGNLITLDRDAAGWGWSADPTAWDDRVFTVDRGQGEQDPMNLLPVLAYEVGQPLGFGHEDHGVMQERLLTGIGELDPEPDHTGVLVDVDRSLRSNDPFMQEL